MEGEKQKEVRGNGEGRKGGEGGGTARCETPNVLGGLLGDCLYDLFVGWAAGNRRQSTPGTNPA